LRVLCPPTFFFSFGIGRTPLLVYGAFTLCIPPLLGSFSFSLTFPPFFPFLVFGIQFLIGQAWFGVPPSPIVPPSSFAGADECTVFVFHRARLFLCLALSMVPRRFFALSRACPAAPPYCCCLLFAASYIERRRSLRPFGSAQLSFLGSSGNHPNHQVTNPTFFLLFTFRCPPISFLLGPHSH